LSRRFAPWRGVDSPPGQELLGVITSHGPSRESYRSSRKSRGSAEAIAPSAADAAVSAEGGARSAFTHGRHASATAARDAGRRHGNGRAGKPKRDTGRRRWANRNGMVKAGATGSASKAGKHQSQMQLTTRRG